MNLGEIKEKLARSCRILEMEAATDRGRGHICFRHPDGDKILIPGHVHDYGRGIADIQAEDIVTMDFNGKVLEGKYPESMGEFYFYTAVFRRRKDVHSAVHIHPPYANVLFGAGKTLIPITRDGCLFYQGVPTFEGFPLYVGTPKMGEEVAAALGECRAIMHRGHGAFVVGRSVEDALVTAITLERAAQAQVLAAGLGSLNPLRVEKMTDREKHPDDHIIEDFFGFFSGKLAKAEKKSQAVLA